MISVNNARNTTLFMNITIVDCEYKFVSVNDVNLSQIHFNNTSETIRDPDDIAMRITIYILVFITSLIGNIIVLSVVSFDKEMRSKTNICIANLALADFVLTVGAMWVFAIRSVTTDWILGRFLCKFCPFLQVTTMCCSIFTMTAIACDRFFAVVYPLKSRSTPRNVALVIAIIWAMSVALGVPAFLGYEYRERKWKDKDEKYCHMEFSWMLCDVMENRQEYARLKQLYERVYWTFVCAVANWLPMCVMQAGYMAIAIIMYRRNRTVSNQGINGQSTVQQRSLKKVLWLLFVLLVVFMICWVPFQVNLVYSLYRPKDNGGSAKKVPAWFEDFQFISILLANSNSAMNPIIYAGLNENFRKGFVKMFCCGRKDSNRQTMYTRSSIVSHSNSHGNHSQRHKFTGCNNHSTATPLPSNGNGVLRRNKEGILRLNTSSANGDTLL